MCGDFYLIPLLQPYHDLPQSSSMVGDPQVVPLVWRLGLLGCLPMEDGRGPGIQLLFIQTSSPNFSCIPHSLFSQYLVLPIPELVRGLVESVLGIRL